MKLCLLIHELTPYRAHLINRFCSELALERLDAILTSAAGGFAWQLKLPAGIQWHDVSEGATICEQGKLARLLREHAKGHRIAQKLVEVQPSAVIVCGYGDAAHRYIIRHCHRRRIPVLLWADSNIRSEPSRGLRRLLKHLLLPRLLRQCDAVLPWGTLGRQYFLKYGVPEERIFVVPAEPDYSLIENTPLADIEATRQRHNLSSQRKRFLFVGRLAAEKRVDLLIAAFAQIAAERPDWDLLIVGDGPLRQRLQASVPEALRPRVTWTGAMTSPAALAPFYHLGDVFVLPSDHEPWGIVVNEAAAAGLPLVCSDIVGAARDLLREPSNGRLFAHGDSSGLGHALLEFACEPTLSRRGAASLRLLTEWRQVADPLTGLRTALVRAGAL